jgi:molecular chaperone HscB
MNVAAPRMTEDEASDATCWRCRASVGAEAAACPACGVVQPPRALDHFARLGLPRGFALDKTTLERRYFDLQRRFHPDRFAGKPAEERALALRHATALNEAYDHLKSPLRRAVYLLGLLDPAYKRDESVTEKDPALLIDALERREALDEANDPSAVDRLVAAAKADIEAVLVRLDHAFREMRLRDADRETARFKYLSKFVEDARDRRRRLSQGSAT